MLNRLLFLAACIIGTMSGAIAVLAQCKYVDPHDRSGYYAWCRCMGGIPKERNGNSVCEMPSTDPKPLNPVAYLGSEYRSQRHQAWQALNNFYYSHNSDTETVLHGEVYTILNNLPDERSIDSLDDAYTAADELAGYFDGYLTAYKRQRIQIQELNNKTDELEKVRQEMLADLRRWGVTQDPNADASLFSKLQTEANDLEGKISKTRQPLEAEEEFNRRMLLEKYVVAKRVLERMHAPLPDWVADQEQNLVLRSLYRSHAGFLEANHCLQGYRPDCFTPPVQLALNDPHCFENEVAYWNGCGYGPPSLPQLEPPIERQSAQNITEAKIRERLKEIDPSPLLNYLKASYPPQNYGESSTGSAVRRARDAWRALDSTGGDYRKFHSLVARISIAEDKIRIASIEIKREDHELSAKDLTDTALWWYFDHLTFVLMQKAGSGDPSAISRLRDVGDEIIKFSKDELELSQWTIYALGHGDSSELKNLDTLMEEKLCDFRRNVDNKAFPLPTRYRFFFPEQISCS